MNLIDQNKNNKLIEDVRKHQPSFTEEIIFFPFMDKWLAASAMQKAIRRGQVELALSAAFSLLQIDSVKLWRRLQVIALEDISLVDLELTQNTLWICSQNQWRRKYVSDEKALIYIITKLSESRKSRVANDLLCIVNAHPADAETAGAFHKLSNQELADIYLSKSFTPEERLIAGWYICGVYRKQYLNMKQRKGDWRYFLSLHNSCYYPELLRLALKQGCSSGEGHFRAIAISWEILNKEINVEICNECNDVTPYLGSWKSEAFDIHTMYGQSAYKLIAQKDNPISFFMRTYFPDRNHVRMLGMSVFSVEGVLLDKREKVSGIGKLLDKATDSYVVNYNLSGAAKTDFFELVKCHFDIVHKERVAIASKIDWKSSILTLKS